MPPIILVVGLLQLYNGTVHAPLWFLEQPYTFLVAAYVILAFPYVYRSLDAGIPRDRRPHADRGGAEPRRLVAERRSCVSSCRTSARPRSAGAFLTLAIVMGEFTIASLALFNTFPIFINQVNQEQPYEAAALSLLSFVITWLAMAGLLLVGRRRPGAGGSSAGDADGLPRAAATCIATSAP